MRGSPTSTGLCVVLLITVFYSSRGGGFALPRQDSNLEWKYQKLLCCLLHHGVIERIVRAAFTLADPRRGRGCMQAGAGVKTRQSATFATRRGSVRKPERTAATSLAHFSRRTRPTQECSVRTENTYTSRRGILPPRPALVKADDNFFCHRTASCANRNIDILLQLA